VKYIGTIEAVNASVDSGLMILFISGNKFYSDNAPMVRALDSLYGCIGPDHTIDTESLLGKRIAFSTVSSLPDVIETISVPKDTDDTDYIDLDKGEE